MLNLRLYTLVIGRFPMSQPRRATVNSAATTRQRDTLDTLYFRNHDRVARV